MITEWVISQFSVTPYGHYMLKGAPTGGDLSFGMNVFERMNVIGEDISSSKDK